MDLDSKIYVAGHTGLVGSAMMRRLEKDGYSNIIVQSSSDLDLTDQAAVRDFFSRKKPEYVFLAAAKVGGIHANSTYPAEFIYQNLMIQNNIIHQSYVNGVKKLLFLGSSCIYPRLAPQPLKEEYLMTGPLEPTNSPYAMAKIAGIEMCWAYNRQYGTQFIPVMPTNMYGPNDNFDLETSHVLPALIRKFHEAKEGGSPSVVIWGTGTPTREFLHVDDLADACLFMLGLENGSMDKLCTEDGKTCTSPLINIGTDNEISILELARIIQDVVGYKGELCFDSSKPDGTPRKILDVSRLKELGWNYRIELRDGLESVYSWFVVNQSNG
ncbi:GDP-L-fucose synthase family protein [Thermodesulfobacteriota bacterium]